MQGVVEEGAAITSAAVVDIEGLPRTYWKSFGELAREVVRATMGDMRHQSTGQVKTDGTVDAEMYIHHTGELAALLEWQNQSDNGAPGYKRLALVNLQGADGKLVATIEMRGVWIAGGTLPALDAFEDGKPIMYKVKLSYDGWNILPA